MQTYIHTYRCRDSYRLSQLEGLVDNIFYITSRMSPSVPSDSVSGLKLLVYEALRYYYMRP